MTVIIGLEYGGKVYIGGDSRGAAEYNMTSRADEKVFHNGPFVMGFTSSFRMGQLLRYKFLPPKKSAKQTDMAYMSCNFIDSIRKCFRTNGFSWDDQGDTGGVFLVAFNKKLYKINGDYQVGSSFTPYDACGCGANVALGAMHVLHKLKVTPQDKIKRALDAACKFNAGCGAPYTILESK